VRYVDRTTRRLSRAVFYAILRFGPGLEKRQAVLGRLVDVGAELFAMSAAVSRAHSLRISRSPEDRAKSETAIALADTFCRRARKTIEDRFDALFDSHDASVYRTAQRVMANEMQWLEADVAGATPPAKPDRPADPSGRVT
jgi:hypothetical protein